MDPEPPSYGAGAVVDEAADVDTDAGAGAEADAGAGAGAGVGALPYGDGYSWDGPPCDGSWEGG